MESLCAMSLSKHFFHKWIIRITSNKYNTFQLMPYNVLEVAKISTEDIFYIKIFGSKSTYWNIFVSLQGNFLLLL